MNVKLNEIAFLQDKRLKETNLLFDGYIAQLYVNKLQLDNGMVVDRELIHHKPAVAVLATHEEKVVLVKQYRPAITQYIWEIPAGILDKDDEDQALEGAVRELEEETGYQANTWEKLAAFYLSPGFLDEKITLYHASDLVKVDNPLPQDDDEDIETRWFTKDEVQKMLQNQEINDLKTLYALQHWLNTSKGDNYAS